MLLRLWEQPGNGIHHRIRGEVYRDPVEWEVSRAAITDAEFMEKIGLLKRPIVPEVKKKRGRPKGSKDKQPRKSRGSGSSAPDIETPSA